MNEENRILKVSNIIATIALIISCFSLINAYQAREESKKEFLSYRTETSQLYPLFLKSDHEKWLKNKKISLNSIQYLYNSIYLYNNSNRTITIKKITPYIEKDEERVIDEHARLSNDSNIKIEEGGFASIGYGANNVLGKHEERIADNVKFYMEYAVSENIIQSFKTTKRYNDHYVSIPSVTKHIEDYLIDLYKNTKTVKRFLKIETAKGTIIWIPITYPFGEDVIQNT